ncbi:hypothetical protein BN14_09145 [Rhizoctonia solani AG-1 IB]|uniref:BTB domain-containing protein n=1 Tax=Thanatephorus cucumeris (strain AG1-IB / isolate 7/3/14) TaxID=1108050 RepID=M5CFV6_THACB|nr:hypothetical protein BN14_09145 [Rhizoctonia solani AG-1 IB]
MESPTGTYDLSFSDASISDPGSHVASPVIVPPSRNSEDSAPMFEAGDGDMYISVNGARFETHKYLIKRFRGLKQLLEQQPAEVSIQCNNLSENDFGEVFKLLYATSHTLVSALRVATVYDYPALRIYCVQCLEALELDAVKRIDIAKEFDLPAWEEPAYHELKMRDNPITREEAEIIGLDALVRIAEMREKEQRRRGKDVDAMHMGNKHDPRAPPKNPNLSEDISLSADTKDKNPSGDRPGGDLSGAPPPQLQLQPLPCFQAEVGATTSMDNSGM